MSIKTLWGTLPKLPATWRVGGRRLPIFGNQLPGNSARGDTLAADEGGGPASFRLPLS